MEIKNKLSKTILIIISVLLLISTIGVAALGISFKTISSKIDRVEVDRNYVTDTGLEPAVEEENVINILLLGTDKFDSETLTASDATMILTIDTINNRIKLCSLMRDTYEDVPDEDPCNLNDVIIKGGPELTLKTINTNFNLQIDKFVQVNLNSLPKIIDILGGVGLNITSDELKYINGYIDNIDINNGTTTEHLTTPGIQTLNGTQARLIVEFVILQVGIIKELNVKEMF